MNPIKTASDIKSTMILVLGGIVLLLLGGYWVYCWGVEDGTMKERGVWNGLVASQKQAELALTTKHNAEMAAVVKDNQRKMRETSELHEAELQKLRVERDADRKRIDALGGLRITAKACTNGDRTGTGAKAPGASGSDEATAGTIRLPEQVENNLWSLVNDADEIVEQARACQTWIRKNGFYGDPSG